MSVTEKLIFQAFGLCEWLISIKFSHFIDVFIVEILKNEDFELRKAFFCKNGILHHFFIVILK